MPVIACAECLGPLDEKNFFFCAPQQFCPAARSMLLTRAFLVSQPACAEARACAGPTTARARPSTRRAAQFAARATPLWCPRLPAHPAPARTVLHLEFGGHGDAPQHVGGEHFCRRCAALPLHARPLTLQLLTAAHPLQSDLVEWTLSFGQAATSHAKRARHGPRRILSIASRFVPRAPPPDLVAHPLPSHTRRESRRPRSRRRRWLAARSRSPSRKLPPPNSVQPSRKSHAASSLPLPCVRRGEPIDLLLKQ